MERNENRFGSPYNIDALRIRGGGYRRASRRIIEGALQCGHTAHLQTERGILAIRPYKIKAPRDHIPGEAVGQNWLLEFYPAGTEHEVTALRTNDRANALKFAYRRLNGDNHGYKAGDRVSWFANQGFRDAEVLAVIEDEVLIEYQMPAGTSALVVCRGIAGKLYQTRTQPHRKLPRRWVRAMHAQGTNDWIGQGQNQIAPVPFPAKPEPTNTEGE